MSSELAQEVSTCPFVRNMYTCIICSHAVKPETRIDVSIFPPVDVIMSGCKQDLALIGHASPGGRVHMCDFGSPKSWMSKVDESKSHSDDTLH